MKGLEAEQHSRFDLEPQNFIFIYWYWIALFDLSILLGLRVFVPYILFKYGNGAGTKSRRATNVFILDDVDSMQWITIDRKLRGKLMMITMIVGFIVHLYLEWTVFQLFLPFIYHVLDYFMWHDLRFLYDLWRCRVADGARAELIWLLEDLNF